MKDSKDKALNIGMLVAIESIENITDSLRVYSLTCALALLAVILGTIVSFYYGNIFIIAGLVCILYALFRVFMRVADDISQSAKLIEDIVEGLTEYAKEDTTE